jgi:hypothetical protein
MSQHTRQWAGRARGGKTNITPASGISILQPRPSDIIDLLNEFEVPHAKFPDELDSKAQA